jgi:hypothetical protein
MNPATVNQNISNIRVEDNARVFAGTVYNNINKG